MGGIDERISGGLSEAQRGRGALPICSYWKAGIVIPWQLVEGERRGDGGGMGGDGKEDDTRRQVSGGQRGGRGWGYAREGGVGVGGGGGDPSGSCSPQQLRRPAEHALGARAGLSRWVGREK